MNFKKILPGCFAELLGSESSVAVSSIPGASGNSVVLIVTSDTAHLNPSCSSPTNFETHQFYQIKFIAYDCRMFKLIMNLMLQLSSLQVEIQLVLPSPLFHYEQ